MQNRAVELKRKTRETDIRLSLNLDGDGVCSINTGVGFFNHMLELFAVHSGFDLSIECKGDIDVDYHHTVEDIGILLGSAIDKALGDKCGIKRFADKTIPMDETVVMCALDLSGRNSFVYDIKLQGNIGDFDSELVKEFFQAIASNGKMNLFFKEFCGDNKHHKAEAVFKSFARCMRSAVKLVSNKIPSSKGVL